MLYLYVGFSRFGRELSQKTYIVVDDISWDNTSWDNISWDNISWDNISWKTLSCEIASTPKTLE